MPPVWYLLCAFFRIILTSGSSSERKPPSPSVCVLCEIPSCSASFSSVTSPNSNRYNAPFVSIRRSVVRNSRRLAIRHAANLVSDDLAGSVNRAITEPCVWMNSQSVLHVFFLRSLLKDFVPIVEEFHSCPRQVLTEV